jgi:hypothetical protein
VEDYRIDWPQGPRAPRITVRRREAYPVQVTRNYVATCLNRSFHRARLWSWQARATEGETIMAAALWDIIREATCHSHSRLDAALENDLAFPVYYEGLRS